MFWTGGGETQYFIAAQGDWFVVTSSDRLGDGQFELAGASLFVVERFFFGDFGEDISSMRRVNGRRPPRPAQPRTAEDVRGGFSISTVQFGGGRHLGLINPTGRTVAVAGGDALTGTMRLAELSLYLDSTVADIKESFLSSDGRPLFSPHGIGQKVAQPSSDSPDVAELVPLIADDDHVNGVSEDAGSPPIRRDESWDRYLYFFYIGQGVTESSGFSYAARQATPVAVSPTTQRRLVEVLARVRESGDPPLEQRWNAAAIVYDRATGTGKAHFFYGDDAENWHLTPTNKDTIAARGLELSSGHSR